MLVRDGVVKRDEPDHGGRNDLHFSNFQPIWRLVLVIRFLKAVSPRRGAVQSVDEPAQQWFSHHDTDVVPSSGRAKNERSAGVEVPFHRIGSKNRCDDVCRLLVAKFTKRSNRTAVPLDS